MYLPNVELSEFQILGAISLSGDPLLTNLQLGVPAMQLLPGQVPAIPQQTPAAEQNLHELPLPIYGKSPNELVPRPLSPPPLQQQ